MNKPSGWENWSDQDRQDYEYLMRRGDDELIPTERLCEMSEKVRGNVVSMRLRRHQEITQARIAKLEDPQCGPCEAMQTARHETQPSGWEDWSDQDRQDYEYLISVADKSLLSTKTLNSISNTAMRAVIDETLKLLYDAAEEVEFAELEDMQCGHVEAMASKQRQLCNKWCPAFKDECCTVNLQTSEFLTVNGAAQVVELCKLPDGLKIIDMKEHMEEPSDE